MNTPEELFERFREQGDETGFRQVFRDVWPDLFRAAHRRSGSAEAAEDLVQDVFEIALASKARFGVDRPLLPWLLATLRNRAARAARARGRSPAVLGDVRDSAAPPDEEAAIAESHAALQNALRGLPSRYRTPLELHVYSGMKASEVARDLGVPAATVRSQLSRGLAMLRESLPAGSALSVMLLVGPRRGADATLKQLTKMQALGSGSAASRLLTSKKAVLAATAVLTSACIVVILTLSREAPANELARLAADEPVTADVRREVRQEVGGAEVVADAAQPVSFPAATELRQSISLIDSDGVPVAGAKVWILDIETIPEARRVEFDSEYDMVRELGRLALSDREGRVEFEFSRFDRVVIAEKGVLCCETSIDPQSILRDDSRCMMKRRRTLEVLVRDREGNLAPGVPVTYLMQYDHLGQLGFVDGDRRRTGADGIARLPIVWEDDGELLATFGFPQAIPTLIPFADGRAELTLPELVKGVATVPPYLLDQMKDVSCVRFSGHGPLDHEIPYLKTSLVSRLVGGRAEVAFLDPLLEFEVDLIANFTSATFARRPTSPGKDRMHFELVSLDRTPTLRAVLRDDEGRRLDHRRVGFSWDETGSFGPFRSDGGGVVEAEVSIAHESESERRPQEILIEAFDDAEAGSTTSWTARVSLPQPQEGGGIDLGDVEMKRPAPVIAGQVLTPAGGAPSRCLVSLYHADDESGLRRSIADDLRRMPEASFDDVYCDCEGRFGFLDVVPGRLSMLVCRDAQHAVTVSPPFLSGDDLAAIRLEKAAHLELCLGANVRRHVGVIRITDRMGCLRERRPPLEGLLRFESLTPGACKIEFLSSVRPELDFGPVDSRGGDDVVILAERIELEEGENRPAVLNPVDRVHLPEEIVLEVVDERGLPMEPSSCAVAKRRDGKMYSADSEGRIRVRRRDIEAGLTLWALGCRPQPVRPGIVEYQMERGTVINLVFKEKEARRNDLFAVAARTDLEWVCDQRHIGESGRASLRVPGHGRYHVWMISDMSSPWRSDGTGLERENAVEIEVTKDAQVFEIPSDR